MKELINQALAKHLRSTRLHRGQSLDCAAEEIGINKATLSRYERGKVIIPAWVLVAYKVMEIRDDR